MKVGTDGVLLGAWADCGNCRTVLDIGAGTGLIALMIAQRNPEASITALEIDPSAAIQARENVQASSWSGRIEVVECDFRNWAPASGLKFDLVTCNPPFFARSLKNPDNQRTQARHDDELPLGPLILKSAGLLSSGGRLALILPAGRIQEAVKMADESGLTLSRRMNVRGNIPAPVKRVLLEWGRDTGAAVTSELVIETGARGVYSDEYRRLTEAFYLSRLSSG